jgi:aryl-alcohol dehydrogenase-like predicted oxidoreductase
VTWRCLQDLVSAGKVRSVGLSNFAAWQVADAHGLARSKGWVLPLVLQPMYNLLARRIEDELLPAARHHDLGVCTYNPLAGGLLTGKHEDLSDPKSESRLARNAYYRERYWHPRLREAASRLLAVARRGGRSLVSLSLRFLLDSPETHCILVGATSREQLEESLACPEEKPLTPEERAACDEIWSDLSGPIPRYHRSNKDDIF